MAGGPILSDLVVLFEGGQKVIHVCLCSVLDCEIIDHEGEADALCGVHP